ncbi:MAG: NAD-dependent epimerase/dehydratase family protein [Ferruginibacter sp.]
MLKIGITGQEGFIGKHLYNTLGLFPDQYERVYFKKCFFENDRDLDAFVSNCDVIVHLAAMNRHNNPDVIYNINVRLVKSLIASLERTHSIAHVIMSSSSQEEKDNPYGKSKKEGRILFTEWANKNNAFFTGLVIPNVFGPFGNPYYNSVVATFCHKLTNKEVPLIDVDGQLKLIYIDELVKVILDQVKSKTGGHLLPVEHTAEFNVSGLLAMLKGYKELYMDHGIIPVLRNGFEINLFNTFRCYMDIKNHFPVKYTQHTDHRGTFTEVIRLNVGGQVSFSTTGPAITRGNHFHTRKIERFSVIKGNALIQLRRIGTEECLDFYVNGEEPAYVDMPIWYTHNITNTGQEDLYTIFWINEFYDVNDPDTYFETV